MTSFDRRRRTFRFSLPHEFGILFLGYVKVVEGHWRCRDRPKCVCSWGNSVVLIEKSSAKTFFEYNRASISTETSVWRGTGGSTFGAARGKAGRVFRERVNRTERVRAACIRQSLSLSLETGKPEESARTRSDTSSGTWGAFHQTLLQADFSQFDKKKYTSSIL